MKWQHWLVWGLLASGAIGLDACAAPEVKALRAERDALRRSLKDHENSKRWGGLADVLVPEEGTAVVGFLVETARWDTGAPSIVVALRSGSNVGVWWRGEVWKGPAAQ